MKRILATLCLLLTACGTEASDPAETDAPPESRAVAPQLPARDGVNAIAVMLTLDSVMIADDELCATTSGGDLLVFSQEVTGDENGIEAGDMTIAVGDQFTTGEIEEIEGGMTCGGTHYDKAIHLLVPFDSDR